MSYYRVCPDCGSHLDPGERCDCKTFEKPSNPPAAYPVGPRLPSCPRLLHYDRKAAEYADKSQSQSIEKQDKSQRRQHHEYY